MAGLLLLAVLLPIIGALIPIESVINVPFLDFYFFDHMIHGARIIMMLIFPILFVSVTGLCLHVTIFLNKKK